MVNAANTGFNALPEVQKFLNDRKLVASCVPMSTSRSGGRAKRKRHCILPRTGDRFPEKRRRCLGSDRLHSPVIRLY